MVNVLSDARKTVSLNLRLGGRIVGQSLKREAVGKKNRKIRKNER